MKIRYLFYITIIVIIFIYCSGCNDTSKNQVNKIEEIKYTANASSDIPAEMINATTNRSISDPSISKQIETSQITLTPLPTVIPTPLPLPPIPSKP